MIYKVFSEEHVQTDIKLKEKITRSGCKIDCVDQLMVIKHYLVMHMLLVFYLMS